MIHFNTKHGMFGTRTYNIWGKMIQRCTNPKVYNFDDYGGRGITVCARWRKFENFFADMGEAPDGLSIERKENDKGYKPGNCEWATCKKQNNNRRSNAFITHGGETKTIQQWAEDKGIEPSLLRWRLKVGKWPTSRAFKAEDARYYGTTNSQHGS